MSFPHQDQYWVDTAKFVQEHIKHEDRLLAPADFCKELPGAYPYSSIFVYDIINSISPQGSLNFQWLLIHKGMIEQLDYNFLKSITKELNPVFANEVFVVFSSHKQLTPLDSSYLHLQAFNEQVKSIISCTKMEMAGRSKCQTAYIGNGTVLCRVLGKYIFYADAEDIGITPHLCLDGYWESWITVAMLRVLQPGWHCVDIGANHGYYSIVMADAVGSSGRVLAVEPNSRMVTLLERTVEVNGFERQVMVLQKAIFDVDDKKVKLVIPPGQGRNASICLDAPAADNVVEVETVTLDRLTRDWPCVDLIKVDAESSEEAIWRGMRDTVRKNQDISIVIEFNCLRCSNPKAFLQDIQTEGFPLRHIDYDSEIKNLTVEQCLTERPNEDWMLFLKRL